MDDYTIRGLREEAAAAGRPPKPLVSLRPQDSLHAVIGKLFRNRCSMAPVLSAGDGGAHAPLGRSRGLSSVSRVQAGRAAGRHARWSSLVAAVCAARVARPPRVLPASPEQLRDFAGRSGPWTAQTCAGSAGRLFRKARTQFDAGLRQLRHPPAPASGAAARLRRGRPAGSCSAAHRPGGSPAPRRPAPASRARARDGRQAAAARRPRCCTSRPSAARSRASCATSAPAWPRCRCWPSRSARCRWAPGRPTRRMRPPSRPPTARRPAPSGATGARRARAPRLAPAPPLPPRRSRRSAGRCCSRRSAACRLSCLRVVVPHVVWARN